MSLPLVKTRAESYRISSNVSFVIQSTENRRNPGVTAKVLVHEFEALPISVTSDNKPLQKSSYLLFGYLLFPHKLCEILFFQI